ncbi:hypothetical protein TI03_02075 [Achromatium sp. WMS1]|nr:hypothetical protein TI03_02075 [Achromatium sp. WMS1]
MVRIFYVSILPPHHTDLKKGMYFTAIIEHCRDTGLYVGYIPGFAGAHAQGETLDELNKNLGSTPNVSG